MSRRGIDSERWELDPPVPTLCEAVASTGLGGVGADHGVRRPKVCCPSAAERAPTGGVRFRGPLTPNPINIWGVGYRLVDWLEDQAAREQLAQAS